MRENIQVDKHQRHFPDRHCKGVSLRHFPLSCYILVSLYSESLLSRVRVLETLQVCTRRGTVQFKSPDPRLHSGFSFRSFLLVSFGVVHVFTCSSKLLHHVFYYVVLCVLYHHQQQLHYIHRPIAHQLSLLKVGGTFLYGDFSLFRSSVFVLRLFSPSTKCVCI